MSGVLRLANTGGSNGRSTIVAAALTDATFTLPPLGGTLLTSNFSAPGDTITLDGADIVITNANVNINGGVLVIDETTGTVTIGDLIVTDATVADLNVTGDLKIGPIGSPTIELNPDGSGEFSGTATFGATVSQITDPSDTNTGSLISSQGTQWQVFNLADTSNATNLYNVRSGTKTLVQATKATGALLIGGDVAGDNPNAIIRSDGSADFGGSVETGFHGIGLNNVGSNPQNEAFAISTAPGNDVYERRVTIFTDGSTTFNSGNLTINSVDSEVASTNAKLFIKPNTTLLADPDNIVGAFAIISPERKTYPDAANSWQLNIGTKEFIELAPVGDADQNTGNNKNLRVHSSDMELNDACTSDMRDVSLFGYHKNVRLFGSSNWKGVVGERLAFNLRATDIPGDANAVVGNTTMLNTTGSLVCPDGATQSLANTSIHQEYCSATPSGSSTINIAKFVGSSFSAFNSTPGTKVINIGEMQHYGTFINGWGLIKFGSPGNLTCNITNYYGLRLRAPSTSGGTLNVTNKYGISQEWNGATNYFAGGTRAAGLELFLHPDDDEHYTVTEEAVEIPEVDNEGAETGVMIAEVQQIRRYTGPTLNVGERLLNVISRLDSLEADEISDDATSNNLITLVSNLTARVDARDAVIADLTTRIQALEAGNN